MIGEKAGLNAAGTCCVCGGPVYKKEQYVDHPYQCASCGVEQEIGTTKKPRQSALTDRMIRDIKNADRGISAGWWIR